MNLLQRSCLLPIRCGIFNQSITSRIQKLITLNNTRTYIRSNKIPKMDRLEAKLKIKDKMPDSTVLIYNNPSAKWIVIAFHFQNFFLIFGTSVSIYYLRKYFNGDLVFPIRTSDYLIAKKPEHVFGFIAFTTLLITFSSLLCKLSVLRIYFDKAKNVNYAVLIGYLPFLKRVITIKPKSLSFVSTFYLKYFSTYDRMKILLYDGYFKRPVDLHKMTKYH